jgi:hypothetical protein
MRSDIRPGSVFPDYSLPDHTNIVRTLSELQGDGYWFWGRPSFYDLWSDLCAASSEIRPDWDPEQTGIARGLVCRRLLELSRLEQTGCPVDAHIV